VIFLPPNKEFADTSFIGEPGSFFPVHKFFVLGFPLPPPVSFTGSLKVRFGVLFPCDPLLLGARAAIVTGYLFPLSSLTAYLCSVTLPSFLGLPILYISSDVYLCSMRPVLELMIWQGFSPGPPCEVRTRSPSISRKPAAGRPPLVPHPYIRFLAVFFFGFPLLSLFFPSCQTLSIFPFFGHRCIPFLRPRIWSSFALVFPNPLKEYGVLLFQRLFFFFLWVSSVPLDAAVRSSAFAVFDFSVMPYLLSIGPGGAVDLFFFRSTLTDLFFPCFRIRAYR